MTEITFEDREVTWTFGDHTETFMASEILPHSVDAVLAKAKRLVSDATGGKTKDEALVIIEKKMADLRAGTIGCGDRGRRSEGPMVYAWRIARQHADMTTGELNELRKEYKNDAFDQVCLRIAVRRAGKKATHVQRDAVKVAIMKLAEEMANTAAIDLDIDLS